MRIDESKSLLEPLVDRSVEHHCTICGATIGKGKFVGVLEVRCRKCGHFVKFASA